MITGEYPPMPGGIAGYTQLLVQALAGQDVDCRVLSGVQSDSDVRVGGWSWPIVRRVRQAVRTAGIDIVHVQYQAGAFQMRPAVNVLPGLVRDAPVVTTFHDLRVPYLFPKAGAVRNLAVKRLARWSSGVIVTNPADGRTLDASGIGSVQIPLGPSLPLPGRSTEPARKVGFFGYPSAQKGFDLLVRAISSIAVPERPLLKIVGSRPPASGSHGFYSQREANRLADQHEVRLEWTGHLEPQRASDALAGCGVIVFPFPRGASLRSSALIAATQTGRPVITTKPSRAGDLGDLATMPNLTMLPAGDGRLLAKSISEDISVPTGEATLPESFQWPCIAARHRQFYESLLHEASR